MKALLSALPILLVLLLMLGLKWRAATSGLTALALALLLALTVFGYGSTIHGDIGPAAAVGGALADAALTAATILWIIVPALCLYQLQMRTRALEVIEERLHLAATQRVQGAPVEPGQFLHRVNVTLVRLRREPSQPHLQQHRLSKWRHR